MHSRCKQTQTCLLAACCVAAICSAGAKATTGGASKGKTGGGSSGVEFGLTSAASVSSGRYTQAFANQSKGVTALKNLLLKAYDKTTTPPGAVVRLQYSFWKIISLRTETQELLVQGWWRMYWRDTRLSWDPLENNLSSITLFAENIWVRCLMFSPASAPGISC